MMNPQDPKTPRRPVSSEIDRVAKLIVESAFAVHSKLGPGLLESVYEVCLAHELVKRQLNVARQIAIPFVYDGLRFENGFRMDLVVARSVVIELKTVESLLPVHMAQLLTYLRLSGHPLGFLINFNVPLIKSGIKRVIL